MIALLKNKKTIEQKEDQIFFVSKISEKMRLLNSRNHRGICCWKDVSLVREKEILTNTPFSWFLKSR